ncbi:hypothetical protein [Actinotalea sp. C106]|uniref:hypothetical protein n=1 Tax=Actinotalea sp. C106 TaxID=2908644 RepID=UPI0020283CF6|nr:hypothetical protein [Actinotalea sp. C106]
MWYPIAAAALLMCAGALLTVAWFRRERRGPALALTGAAVVLVLLVAWMWGPVGS